ncbi:DUF6705 family protein [Chitinophaga barathri]|uniref:DUF6705 domain-containing protein n=1 Tax=Chitinophaga barathri TaxID=1647451 RepID=A0A3N4MGP6_9BACT|nr:DUF6705 family protein [Chitinophaga barathri]RPD43144.1 hypothetical protein EG028_02280 [Chitinophaga barathri]
MNKLLTLLIFVVCFTGAAFGQHHKVAGIQGQKLSNVDSGLLTYTGSWIYQSDSCTITVRFAVDTITYPDGIQSKVLLGVHQLEGKQSESSMNYPLNIDSATILAVPIDSGYLYAIVREINKKHKISVRLKHTIEGCLYWERLMIRRDSFFEYTAGESNFPTIMVLCREEPAENPPPKKKYNLKGFLKTD